MTKRLVLMTGMAMFAMFFGAGNIVFPLLLGAKEGGHLMYVIPAFLFSGVGLPFLGLLATALYQADYWALFQRLGKIPAFILITFLFVILGPLLVIPRTESVAYHTLAPFLPFASDHPYLMSALFCGILFLLTFRPSKVIDIISYFLSPMKLILFLALIVLGLVTANYQFDTDTTIMSSVKEGLLGGYGTMDLIGTFFFCTYIYNNIVLKAKEIGIINPKTIIKMLIQSCLVSALLLSLVYIGFMLVAFGHATSLQNLDPAQMIEAIAVAVMGKTGGLFVGFCVAFACLVTATALTEVSTNFFYEYILQKRVPRLVCLIASLMITFTMSIFGFNGIMKIALPVLEVLYPGLILYCVFSIILKWVADRKASDTDAAVGAVVS